MRKVFKMLLSVFLALIFIVPINAEQSMSLYAYTSFTEGFDEYAQEKVAAHMYTYYGYIDETLVLGKGITVYGDVAYPMVVYPVWKNNSIVATFKVININGTFSGSFSEGNINSLNYLKSLTSANNPLRMVVDNGDFVFVVNDVLFDAEFGNQIIDKEIDINEYIDGDVINSIHSISYRQITLPRIPSSWNLPWTLYYHNAGDQFNCYAYSLANTLTNLGYSGYSFDAVQEGFRTTVIRPMINFSEIAGFLDDEGISYRPPGNTGSGSLLYSTVISMIYSSRLYIIAGLSFANSTTNHIGVITGYSSVGSQYYYQIYDPRSESVNGKCTMDETTKTFSNSKGEVFVWDDGYVIIEKP